MTGQGRSHPWLPETTCDHHCVLSGLGEPGHLFLETLRCVRRITAAALVLMVLPLLAVPLPGHLRIKRLYCRAMLSALGIRITLSGGPIRNLRGMLVVSNHVSWVDVFTVGAVLPGTFVARADLIDWPAVGLAARLARIIPIDRGDLRGLPAVVDAVAGRLRGGSTVVAFPEGTTYCGADHGRFRPALFQSAIDAARPVQPVRLTYHHRDGKLSTATAFLGEDTLWASLKRTARAPRTVVHLEVRPLELPGVPRNELAARCETAIRVTPVPHRDNCANTEV